MRMKRRMSRWAGRRGASGFSMIEVLIALLVLAVGLLGFALLQTMNLRFTQSANHRTQAINLASDLLDQMRANRNDAAWYAASASFSPDSLGVERCSRPLDTASYSANVERWQCQVVSKLGSGSGVVASYTGGEVSVEISWGDERWNPSNPGGSSAYKVETQL